MCLGIGGGFVVELKHGFSRDIFRAGSLKAETVVADRWSRVEKVELFEVVLVASYLSSSSRQSSTRIVRHKGTNSLGKAPAGP